LVFHLQNIDPELSFTKILVFELPKFWSLSYQKIGRHWSFRNVLGYLCTCL